MEIRKAKNEKRINYIEQARRKESRMRIMKKKKNYSEISEYGGFWLSEEQISLKLPD